MTIFILISEIIFVGQQWLVYMEMNQTDVTHLLCLEGTKMTWIMECVSHTLEKVTLALHWGDLNGMALVQSI